MKVPQDILVSYRDRIQLLSEDLYEASKTLEQLADYISDLVISIDEHTIKVNEEMKQFDEGFKYVRTKTSGAPRKKPVLHGLEPKRNKRKPEQATRSNDANA